VAEHTRSNTRDFERSVDPESGVIAVKTASVTPEKFDTGNPGDQVYLKDVLTLDQSPRLGCGVMEMTASTFDWFLKYDEVDVVLEGSLSIVIGDRTMTADKGDIVFIPRDTAIKFSVPDHARFIYMTYPADWEQQ
jgi:ethanolamine utilization protein EutQ